eukprot:EG_transcript_3402
MGPPAWLGPPLLLAIVLVAGSADGAKPAAMAVSGKLVPDVQVRPIIGLTSAEPSSLERAAAGLAGTRRLVNVPPPGYHARPPPTTFAADLLPAAALMDLSVAATMSLWVRSSRPTPPDEQLTGCAGVAGWGWATASTTGTRVLTDALYRDAFVAAGGELTKYHFRYSSPADRRAAVLQAIAAIPGPRFRIQLLLLGKPSSGKGTIAPLLSQCYSAVHVCVGDLLRAEVRAGTSLGKSAKELMRRGDLLPTSLVLELVKKRIAKPDCVLNGWILDGFPRNEEQAVALREAGVIPDGVVTLDRPDDLVREFCFGRCTDGATGIIYHPRFNPPPAEVHDRLLWRLDDTPETVERRLAQFHAASDATVRQFDGICPRKTFDSARNDLEVFREVAHFVNTLPGRVAVGADASPPFRVLESWGPDVPVITADEPQERTLLAAVKRCNNYDMRRYVPVYAGTIQIGYAKRAFAEELVQFRGRSLEMSLTDEDGASYISPAPFAKTALERTTILEGMVQCLVASGTIPGSKIRNEKQEVRPLFDNSQRTPPLLYLERGALIHFGIPSAAVHINGFVRTADGVQMWVAKRAASKATYPGLLDQFVAGGQPAHLTFHENAVKECQEEASCPEEVLRRLRPCGQVSYRYTTRRGLSTKVINVFDCELPPDFQPFNGDGEVEEFRLMPMEAVLHSLRYELPRWKPNSALTVVDFAVRHGFLGPDDPDYVEICHLLRCGVEVSWITQLNRGTACILNYDD